MRPRTLPKPAYVLAGAALLGMMALPGAGALAGSQTTQHAHLDCSVSRTLCTETYDSAVFGPNAYVGHDEPSLLFYSNTPGSGNTMTYHLTLPKDPSVTGDPRTNGKSYNFQLHPTFWFGMAMCDDQSYPESQVTFPGAGSTCTPDSSVNNVTFPNPSGTELAHHAGSAFMEMQFYPPGWAPWPAGVSCDPTSWCAALNIDSLSEDPVTGQTLNSTCAAKTGLEYVNFAFITHDGVPIGPPNPVQSTTDTFNPTSTNPHHADVAFYHPGDQLTVGLADTAAGLKITIDDLSNPSQNGFMVASAANNFGMVQFAPTGTTCNNIPYNFHPMYSTSSQQTRVIWAAHSYNIAFSDETGHFDYCGHVEHLVSGAPPFNTPQFGNCSQNEGVAGDTEPSDKDDTTCFPASESLLVPTSGCIDINAGFDGVPYQPLWPDGNANHPAPVLFTSPLSNGTNYSNAVFEADLPRIEAKDVSPVNNCNRTTGAGCVNPPLTDDGAPATFYPFYSAAQTTTSAGSCVGWIFGNHIGANPQDGSPAYTLNDFGKNLQYGPLYLQTYLILGGGGATRNIYDDFHNDLGTNPCPS
jgi:hypothetical protein